MRRRRRGRTKRSKTAALENTGRKQDGRKEGTNDKERFPKSNQPRK